jgi:hypothetical protein
MSSVPALPRDPHDMWKTCMVVFYRIFKSENRDFLSDLLWAPKEWHGTVLADKQCPQQFHQGQKAHSLWGGPMHRTIRADQRWTRRVSYCHRLRISHAYQLHIDIHPSQPCDFPVYPRGGSQGRYCVHRRPYDSAPSFPRSLQAQPQEVQLTYLFFLTGPRFRSWWMTVSGHDLKYSEAHSSKLRIATETRQREATPVDLEVLTPAEQNFIAQVSRTAPSRRPGETIIADLPRGWGHFQ